MMDYAQLATDYPQGKEVLRQLLARCQEERELEGAPYVPLAREFEQRHKRYNITGVAANWAMPPGTAEAALEEQLQDRRILAVALQNERAELAPASPLYPIVDDLIQKTDADNRRFLSGLWESLKHENPALADITLTPGHTGELFDAVWGCISQFNKDDIVFYRDDQRSGGTLRNSREYKNLKREIGIPNWKWVPSPETMEKVKAQLHGHSLGPDTPF